MVDQALSEEMFIVDITVGTGNSIEVLVDSDKGISIEDCVKINRHIEQNLDRDVEDFSLEVSSPGLTQPFKHLRQYQKNIGKKVELVARSGEKEEGILKSVNAMNMLIEEWGGKYQSQDISAKTGMGVAELLEKVLLEADLLDLKANPNKRAVGSVIESSLDKGRGYVATVLVQNGTLKIGDVVLAGPHFGHIKAMITGIIRLRRCNGLIFSGI